MALSYRAAQQTVVPQRSAFGAAVLSLIFPGLGQAYVGAWARALAFAAPMLLGLSAIAGLFFRYGPRDFLLWIGQSTVLFWILILNVVVLGYRAFAIVDAYRLAQYANAYETAARGLGRPRLQSMPISLAGLAGILLILALGHVDVWKYGSQLYQAAVETHSNDPIVQPTVPPPSGAVASAIPSFSIAPSYSLPPAPSQKPWTGTDRLNILLIGVDQRPSEGTFNTDTMIVVSIDPVSKQIAMFSIPRDVVGLPTPPGSGLSRLFGSSYNLKINSLWMNTDLHRDLFPGGGAQALKQELGYVYGLNIQYYLMVNFSGFRDVVDTLGGVTLNVEFPVVDDQYPGDNGSHLRVYYQPGIQHMNGTQALIYARSRHGSDDFVRGARQQQVITAIKDNADANVIASHIMDLVGELSQAVRTDIPEGPDVLGPLIDLGLKTSRSGVKQYVFAPNYNNPALSYGIEHNDPSLYWIEANVPKIRATVKAALSGATAGPDEAALQAAVTEGAPIVIENGTGKAGQATGVATYLQSLGLTAQATTTQPSQTGGVMQIQAVNGAETRYPATMQLIGSTLGITPQPVTIPGAPVEFIVITGTNTPSLSPAPSG